MEKQQILVRLLPSRWAALQVKIKTLFGLQAEERCFSSGDEIILEFVVDPACAGQLLSYLRAKKAMESILDVSISTLSETSEEETGWDDKEPQEQSPEEDIAYAESALATLSKTWVQNVFGAQVADVIFVALKELIESRQSLIMQRKEALIECLIPDQRVVTLLTENGYVCEALGSCCYRTNAPLEEDIPLYVGNETVKMVRGQVCLRMMTAGISRLEQTSKDQKLDD